MRSQVITRVTRLQILQLQLAAYSAWGRILADDRHWKKISICMWVRALELWACALRIARETG